MANAGASIEAVLSLNASGFNTGITQSVEALNRFITATDKLKTGDVTKGIEQLTKAFISFQDTLLRVDSLNQSSINTFSKVSNAINKMANGLRILQSEEVSVVQGVNTMNSIFQAFQGALNGTSVKLDGVVTSEKLLISSNETLISSNQRLAQSEEQVSGTTAQASASEERLATTTNQATSTVQKQASATGSAVGRTNQLTSSVNSLSKAMNSLKMIGSLVASMMVWNFASSLVTATRNTVNAKSEMEGYFQMLHFGSSDIAEFNKALDDTVSQFQRVNKYSIGETIASIGVEFNLSTAEMQKAMKVTSMITSEYLRAGRNAEEASLAVKDVLQGQFQRLSRETGVKGEQLKEAGWSGDVNDVMGLMEALEKVAESRNWDVFAEKANSLNDIVTILQNRFGEWSADLVYAVQPAIVGTFNNIMSVAEVFGSYMSGLWEKLNDGSIESNVVQWGLLGGAILSVSQILVSYRAGVGLVEASQLGLTKSIASLVLGLKAEQVANLSVRNSILSKILSVNAEAIAERGLGSAIQEKLLMTKAETVEERLNTFSSEENTVAKKIQAVQERINKAEKEGLITATELETVQEELNTVSKEANILATETQTGANTGLIASLYALGTGEVLVAGETDVLAVSMGVLNGVFALSPVGWLAVGVLALASAFYVLSGGLDKVWGQMKTFNETVDQGYDALKGYKDAMEDLEKQGKTNTQEYKDLNDAYQKNIELIQRGTAQRERAERQYGELNATIDTHLKKVLEDNHVSQQYIENATSLYESMTTGINKYYHAMQVMNFQTKKMDSDLQSLTKSMQENGKSGEEIAKVTGEIASAYADLENWSYIANTTDDWFEWLWASFNAGVSQFWIDWNEFWANPNWEDFSATFGKIGDYIVHALSPLTWFTEWIDWGALKKYFGEKGIVGVLMDVLGLSKMGADTITQAINQYIFQPLYSWVNWFVSNLPDSLIETTYNTIEWFYKLLFGQDFDIYAWMHDQVIVPIQDWINGFLADPLSYIMNGIVSGSNWVMQIFENTWFGSDFDFTGWIADNILNPFMNALNQALLTIPIVDMILSLFGLVDDGNSGASQLGDNLGKAFGEALSNAIASIPILGDILKLLGVIPQAEPTASSNGKSVGGSIKSGFKGGITGMATLISDEIGRIITTIQNAISRVGQVAFGLGGAILGGIKNGMDMHSPSIISRELLPQEFGVNIPNAITSNIGTVYGVAQTYGQAISDGISSVNMNTFGGLADEYQSDAQIISYSSQMMGNNTTDAFNDMQNAVNTSTASMSSNVVGTYSTLEAKQSTSLQNMKTKNTTAYNDMYTKSNQSLIQMRDSTSKVTEQMTQAWSHMKDQIIASANKLKTDSTNHFNQLSNTIGTFYRKIQNPSQWGAGTSSMNSQRRSPTFGRRVGSAIRGHGAGSSNVGSWTGKSTMSVAQLKRMLCPNGDCGTLFDGYSGTDVVDVDTFLRSIQGEHGFGGWLGWNTSHYNHIKTKSDAWNMGSPIINLVGGIPTNAKFKVGEFNNGTPKVSFGTFQDVAGSIFSRIPYKHYYDSSWKGSWLGALQAGACNCSDGADALIALASVFGFNGYKQWGTWNGEGHFWAVINGVPMDTTAWQGGYGWTSPKVRGYGASNIHGGSSENKEVHIHINMSDNTIYGVDDLDNRMEEAVKRGLHEEFNDPYTVVI